jgi:hypothetical protein
MQNIKPLIHNIVAAIAGTLAAGFTIAAVQSVNARLYPPPAGMDWKNAEAVAAFFRALPLTAFLVVLAAYAIGVTLGAWLAGKLSANFPHRQTIIVTALFFAASVMNLMSLPHPGWFWIANLTLVPVCGWLALRLLGTPKTEQSP